MKLTKAEKENLDKVIDRAFKDFGKTFELLSKE